MKSESNTAAAAEATSQISGEAEITAEVYPTQLAVVGFVQMIRPGGRKLRDGVLGEIAVSRKAGARQVKRDYHFLEGEGQFALYPWRSCESATARVF